MMKRPQVNAMAFGGPYSGGDDVNTCFYQINQERWSHARGGVMRPLTGVLVVAWMLVAPVEGQWVHQPTSGIPRTPDGKPNLAAPAPRGPDGKPDLSGLWERPADRYFNNIMADLKPEEIQPWAEALYHRRLRDFQKDSMITLCLPLGPTYNTTPYRESRIVQTPTLIAILNDDLTHRQIFMDGRTLEKDPNPNWMGYSVGRWDGDTLVVESNGFNDRTWLDSDGHPHTDGLRITERYRRPDFGHMELQMTLDDPGVYPKPWTVTVQMAFAADLEMIEYFCENEKDRKRMDSQGPRLSEAPLDPATLAQYVGVYEFTANGENHTAEIIVSNGVLSWDQDGAGKQKLFGVLRDHVLSEWNHA
jgi:hypothetical protein